MRGLFSSRVALYSLSLKDFRAPPRVLKTAVYSGVSTWMSRAAGAAFATGAFSAGAPGTAAGAAACCWPDWACVCVCVWSCFCVSRFFAKKYW